VKLSMSKARYVIIGLEGSNSETNKTMRGKRLEKGAGAGSETGGVDFRNRQK